MRVFQLGRRKLHEYQEVGRELQTDRVALWHVVVVPRINAALLGRSKHERCSVLYV